MSGGKQANFKFQFIVPNDDVLEAARGLANSPEQDIRDVAKSLLDATAITLKTHATLARNVGTDASIDLAEYYDHWMGDAVEAAQRLLTSADKPVADMARCLIDQSEAMINSKKNFLNESKRLQGG